MLRMAGFLYAGLSTPQDWGTWVNGDKASFMFSFNEKDVASDLVLDIDYVPYLLSDTVPNKFMKYM